MGRSRYNHVQRLFDLRRSECTDRSRSGYRSYSDLGLMGTPTGVSLRAYRDVRYWHKSDMCGWGRQVSAPIQHNPSAFQSSDMRNVLSCHSRRMIIFNGADGRASVPRSRPRAIFHEGKGHETRGGRTSPRIQDTAQNTSLRSQWTGWSSRRRPNTLASYIDNQMEKGRSDGSAIQHNLSGATPD